METRDALAKCYEDSGITFVAQLVCQSYGF